MKVQYVSPEYTVQVWPKVKKFLEPAMAYSNGEFNLDQAQVYVNEGIWSLIVVVNETDIQGAVLVKFFNYANERVAFVMAIGGRLISNHDTFEQLKQICKLKGATIIEGAARESVARMWRKYGFAEKYRIVGVKL